MDYHYSLLQAVFDGWILVLVIACTVVSALRLRGRRRLLVTIGFGLWVIATLFWMPALAGRIFEPLVAVMDYELVWQLPLIPWLIGAVLIAVGVFLAPTPAPARTWAPPPGPPPGPGMEGRP